MFFPLQHKYWIWAKDKFRESHYIEVKLSPQIKRSSIVIPGEF